jgi:ABC-type multidrug transport system fused ATPase/permease subunit
MKLIGHAIASSPSLAVLVRLWKHLSSSKRNRFKLLIALMVIASAAEFISIGALIPFLGVLTAPETVYDHRLAQPMIEAWGLRSHNDLLVPATVLFASSILIACAVRILLLWASTRLAYATGSDIGIEIYRRTLYQPYAVHVSRNSSEIIDAVTTKTHAVINGVVYPLVNLAASSIILTTLLAGMLIYQPAIALLAFTSAGVIYVGIFRFSRRRLIDNSLRIADYSTRRIKALQEGLGGIRDLLIDGTQSTYCCIYREADLKLRKAQAENVFIGSSPRFIVEALAMVLIALLGLSLALHASGISAAIPLLGGLALGAQRMLPMLQQVYQGWTSFRGSRNSLMDVIDLLEQPMSDSPQNPPPLRFENVIRLEKIGFQYQPMGQLILDGVDLTISRGGRIGIVGATGSGKSTLLDIIMGLLLPTQGRLLVDGEPITERNQRAWQRHIAHVPQSIFLADATIEENIAFGVPRSEIDSARVYRAAEQAQIAASIQNWPQKYDTVVGERGVRLSGGQRQRIGIARALYRHADVIVLDEATSALDNATEDAVMASIDGLDRSITLIIIAHRTSTLRGCDFILELAEGHAITKPRGVAAANF